MRSPSPGAPADVEVADRIRRGRGGRVRPAAGGRFARARWPLAILLLAAAACAKEEPPPGAELDDAPPSIREVVPADGAVVSELEAPLKIRFDEPIEPPRGLARRLVASPFAEYGVEYGFDEIRIRPEEGWLPAAVYRIRIPVPVADLLGNERTDTLEIAFSTGPPLTETRVAGRIVSRVDRRPQQGARVLFLAREGDSVPYGAVADTGGRFELRSVPPGTYRAYGFRDLNADRSLERRLEPWDSATFRLPDGSATAELRLSLLEPDSTPPRLALAEPIDSAAVELTFDDHLDPAQPFPPTAVRVTDGSGGRVPVAAVAITRAAAGLAPGDTAATGPAAGTRPDTAPPAADTVGDDPAAGDTAARADTAAAAIRDTAAGPDSLPPGAAPSDTLPLPSRTLYVRTARGLRDSVRYRVRVRDVRNLQGLAGGGDTTFVHVPAADTAARGDTTAAAPAADTAAGPDPVPIDSARRDTTPREAAADSASRDPVVPDTASGDGP